MMIFPRDGQMQTIVRTGCANYEVSNLAGHSEEGGSRECSITDLSTVLGRVENEEQGDKLRMRAEWFADRYSQAHLFRKSQADNRLRSVRPEKDQGHDRREHHRYLDR